MTFFDTSLAGDDALSGLDRVSLRDVVRDATAADNAALDHALAGLDLGLREGLVRFSASSSRRARASKHGSARRARPGGLPRRKPG